MIQEKNVFIQAFGRNEWGWVDFPHKISNVRIARIGWGDAMGCARCFPHGWELPNATRAKNRRSWKFYRRRQYRSKP